MSFKSSCFSEQIYGPEVQIEPSVSITASRSLGDLFNAMDSSARSQEVEDEIEKEIKWYSSLPVAQDKNHDVLAWWSKLATTFPRLALLARKYLCGTANSVPSERLGPFILYMALQVPSTIFAAVGWPDLQCLLTLWKSSPDARQFRVRASRRSAGNALRILVSCSVIHSLIKMTMWSYASFGIRNCSRCFPEYKKISWIRRAKTVR